MLRGVDNLLTADLLWVLAAMGHGDDIAVVDEHFPADSIARATVYGRPIRVPGVDCTSVTRAILSVLPLDETASESAWRMDDAGVPGQLPPVQAEVQHEVDLARGASVPMGTLGRDAYYDAARRAYAVVWTGDVRVFGCFVFKKGFLAPPALAQARR